MLFRYYKLVDNKRIDLIVPGLVSSRVTHLSKKLSDLPDDKKTCRALRANITHFYDAYLIRQITLRLGRPVITIHDCIGIDILSILKFERVVRECFQELYDKDIFKLNKKNNIKLVITSNCIFL
jgi:hypothetical protein